MVINSVLVTGSLVLSLIRAPASSEPRLARRPIAPTRMAAADSFSPPPKTRKRRPPSRSGSPGVQQSPESTDDDTEEAAPPTKRQSTPPSSRRQAPAVNQDGDDTAQDEDEDRPKAKRHATRARPKAADEDDEADADEDDEPVASLPAVLPRLVSFMGGVSVLGRQFQFNTPLQKEATFPRIGVALSIEAYPLIRLPRGWFRKFGIGVSYGLEKGTAALLQGDGSSNSFPVKQQRWSIDLRYVVPLGERVVVIPATGYASSVFELQRPTLLAPSSCTNANTTPCLAGTTAGFLMADLHLRIAVTPEFALSLMGGYLQGLGVGNTTGQIGSEASSTSLAGFHGAINARWMQTDWLAIQMAIPFMSYAYKFRGGTATYGSASETYYGLILSAVVFTP